MMRKAAGLEQGAASYITALHLVSQKPQSEGVDCRRPQTEDNLDSPTTHRESHDARRGWHQVYDTCHVHQKEFPKYHSYRVEDRTRAWQPKYQGHQITNSNCICRSLHTDKDHRIHSYNKVCGGCLLMMKIMLFCREVSISM